ncbi:activating signal cointegrator 1 complex subunit 2 homolog [Sarcophilus harrisii]|uniref:activating signal cointegrator 1 complex subunit 2 homolog n=1 Tax=Sarcophilus harrisii TaxID=9305 RepID=UPI0013019D9F|nr:activating signal cointegrator 1 complex subunit 2 homolog [Sarcophilus harrisii]
MMASKPETTKGLGLEERAIFSEIFPPLLNSTSSSCMSWVDSEEMDNNSSLFDESSPSESSISTGYFPSYQIQEDISDKSVYQRSVTNEKVCEKSDSDHSGKDNQNKDRPDRGIVIKYIITGQDNKITVSKRDLVTPAKDLKPSDLTVIDENFLGKMDFNIHKRTWQKIEWNHQKSLPTLEKELLERRHHQRKFKPQFKQQAKPQAKPQARSQAKPPKPQTQPQTKPQAKSQARRNELWHESPPRTQPSHGDPPPLTSRFSFHRLFQWFRQTFTRRTRVNPLGENMQPEATQEQPRSWGSRLWRCLSLKRFRSGNQVQPYPTLSRQ